MTVTLRCEETRSLCATPSLQALAQYLFKCTCALCAAQRLQQRAARDAGEDPEWSSSSTEEEDDDTDY